MLSVHVCMHVCVVMYIVYYYKPGDYVTIYKTTNAMLMINTEVTHTTLLDDVQAIR